MLIIISLAGACAGLVCDIVLFPLDTIKSRLQSPEGFIKAGGFKHIYKGLSVIALNSGFSSSLFFINYEIFKIQLTKLNNSNKFNIKLSNPFIHMISASIGEFVRFN